MGAAPARPGARGLTLGRLRRAPRYLRTRATRAANTLLDRVETATADGGPAPLRHPPLFIVGAPRSGSTLLYQLAVHAFDVGYVSNLHCRLYGAPSLVERVWHPSPPADFASRYGRTRGAAAPSECGELWYRFFPRSPQYVPLERVPAAQLARVRAAVRALGDAAGRPLVLKNLVCSLRLAPLGAALPEAVFVVVRRDLVANAVSLLEGRRTLFGDYGRWWSAEPPGVEELRGLPPHEQVVEQVRRIDALIERDRARLGEHRFLELRYEAICADAEGALQAIAGLAERNGFRLRQRRPAPPAFRPSAGATIEPELRERVAAYAGR